MYNTPLALPQDFSNIPTAEIIEAVQGINESLSPVCLDGSKGPLDIEDDYFADTSYNGIGYESKLRIANAYQKKIALRSSVRRCGTQSTGTIYRTSTGRAHMSLRRCTVQTCVYCSSLRAKNHQDKISRLLKKASAAGLDVSFGVLSLPRHKKSETTKSLEALKTIWSKAFHSRNLKALDIVGVIRATELVYTSDLFSANVHTNFIVIYHPRNKRKTENLHNTLITKWLETSANFSREFMAERQCQFIKKIDLDEETIECISSYASKIGKKENWDISAEVTMNHCKIGGASLGPVALLLKAKAGSRWCKAQYYDYESSIHGVRLFAYSHKLENKIDGFISPGDEVEVEEKEEIEIVSQFSVVAGYIIRVHALEELILLAYNDEKYLKERNCLDFIFLQSSIGLVSREELEIGFKLFFQKMKSYNNDAILSILLVRDLILQSPVKTLQQAA